MRVDAFAEVKQTLVGGQIGGRGISKVELHSPEQALMFADVSLEQLLKRDCRGFLNVRLRDGLGVTADIFPGFVAGGRCDQDGDGVGLVDSNLPALGTDCTAFVLDEHADLEFQPALDARRVAVLAVYDDGITGFNVDGGSLRGGKTGGDADLSWAAGAQA